MNARCASPLAGSSSAALPADARGWLSLLRQRLEGNAPAGDVEHALAALAKTLEQMSEEHDGMSTELITVYEQLGIVFEVTHRLPGVRDEWEVVSLIRDSLARSFSAAEVQAARPRGDGWTLNGCEVGSELAALLNQAREQGKVSVEHEKSNLVDPGAHELMIVPVFAGGDCTCCILLSNQPKGREFRASDMLLVESLATFCGDLIQNHRLLRELHEMSLAMVRSLVNAVDQKDEYTSGHSIRVSFYAMLLGRKYGLEPAALQMLQWSALLHDVGKIGIRDDVLKKAGRLTNEEFAHIKEHPVRSYKVVQEVPQLAAALDGILYHHEHYDGTGYPRGLAGEQIPLQARIIQIADVFDALTSTRSYRGAHEWQIALNILAQEAGTVVDPQLQAIFDQVIRGELTALGGDWNRLTERANAWARAADLPLQPMYARRP